MKKKFAASFALCFLLFAFFSQDNFVCAAGRFETPRFDVNITVGENNILHVEERITMNLVEQSRGLVRNIPYHCEVVRSVNGEVKREKKRAEIKNVTVQGHNFKTYRENSNLYIRIGKENKYLTGTQQYNISYDFVLGKDSDTTQDLLYFNILPVDWNSKIENSTLTITMPKSFDSSKLEFIATKQNKTDLFHTSVTGNVITAKLKQPLTNGNTATAVMLHLPEGYFSEAGTVRGSEVIVFLVLTASLLFAVLLIAFIHFHKKPVKVIEYLPPNDMSPVEIGYLYDTNIEEHLSSIIIYWADKGYLFIEEDEDGDIFLYKIKELPAGAPKYEKYFFDSIFKDADQIALEDTPFIPPSKSSSTSCTQANTGDTDIPFVCLSDIKYRLGVRAEKTAEKAKKHIKKFVTLSKNNRPLSRVLLYINTLFPLVTFYLFGASEGFMQGQLPSLYIFPFFPICLYLLFKLSSFNKANTNDTGALKKAIVVIIAVFALAFAALYFIENLTAVYLLLFVFSLFTFFCNGLLLRFHHAAYTEEYSALLGRVLGFRDFIENAEKEKLEELIEQYPHYFYRIAPYAYVLGVSEKWANKFEVILSEAPDWYITSDSGSFSANTFTDNMNHMLNSTTVVLQDIIYTDSSSGNSSSSHSSGSSSFSSGGGSSSGGFGGGGGNTW